MFAGFRRLKNTRRGHGRKPLCAECLERRLVLDSTVVFNEIMYNVPGNDEGMEWVELHNQMAVDMDLSGWRLDGGVRYDFPEGTVIPGHGYLVVASDPDKLLESAGVNDALGPFRGRLANDGEDLVLLNNIDSFVTRPLGDQPLPSTVVSESNVGRRVMDSVDYDDRGDWPIAPDGSGVSLAKRHGDLGSADPASWTWSAQVGGTPGRPNFIPVGSLQYDQLISSGQPARVTVPLGDSFGRTWLETAYDDSAWTHGTTGVGFDNATTYDSLLGLDLDAPPDGQPPVVMQGLQQSVFIRIPFQVDAGLDQYDILLLRMKYDDGFVAYVNGVEVAHANAPGRDGNNGTLSWISGATGSHSDRDAVQFVDFDVTEYRDAFVTGQNVLAIHGLNRRATDADLLFLPELVGGTVVRPDPWDRLVLSEVAAADSGEFWIEIGNGGDQSVDLSGFEIVATGDRGGRYVFPSRRLGPGAMTVVSAGQLGFQPSEGDKLFLYTPERLRVLDGHTVQAHLQGRAGGKQSPWQYPDRATPGSSNSFSFQNNVVINEIMYHGYPDRGNPPLAPVVERVPLLAMDADGWRYRETAGSLPSDWAAQSHSVDGQTWFEGQGPLGFSVDLKDQLNTGLSFPTLNNPPFTTYYFETEFEFSGTENPYELVLNHLVDDGAVFYLNGQEIHRVNMPTGNVTGNTPAAAEVRNAQRSAAIAVPADLLRVGTNRLSVEVHQIDVASFDIVMGAELAMMEQVVPAQPAVPYEESLLEWIELYNRSSSDSVSLAGWQLTGGVDFDFPTDTTIGPNEYLVIANDAQELAASYPGLTAPVLDGFQRRLSNTSDTIILQDNHQNVADRVTYYDGGRWPGAADGNGSTLELRDPRADNESAEAWQASDESTRSAWQTYTYRGIATDDGIGTNRFHEFVLGLLDAGEVLLDDISVVEDPRGAAIQFIQNGDFQRDPLGQSPQAWRLIGTHGDHGRSRVVADPDDPANRVLHLVATGPTEDKHNQASTTYAGRERVQVGTEYEVSFRAKWLSGSNQVNTRLYFNYLQRTTLIDVPGQGGTPGERNRAWVENVGPTYTDLAHQPVVPLPSQAVTVSVVGADPDGVTAMTLVYAVDGSLPQTVPMAEQGQGVYTGKIPPHADRTIVQFYVEGTDSRGARSTFPALGPQSRALYTVDEGRDRSGDAHSVRVIMTDADTDFMYRNVNRMSNDRRGATVVYNERQVFYGVGVRIKGSAWGRNNDSVAGLSLRFAPDNLFRGVHETVSIERSGNPKELIAKHMLNRAAGGLSTFYDDVAHVIMPRSRDTGIALLAMARTTDVYLDSLHEGGGDAPVYNMELLYSPQGTVDGDPESAKLNFPYTHSNGRMDIGNYGDDKETYRWNFQARNARGRDDYEPLIALGKAFSKMGDELQSAVSQLIDVDQWMRTFAMLSLNGNDDLYSRLWEHNFRMYVRPEDGLLVAVPWDLDRAFQLSTSATPWGTRNNEGRSVNLSKVIEIPAHTRLFWGHVWDIINTTANEQYMQRWTDHYGQMMGRSFAAELRYISSRAAYLERRMPPPIPFEITSGNGQPLNATGDSVELEGRGWIDVRALRLAGSDQSLSVTWLDDENWLATVPLSPGLNTVTMEAINHQGNVVGTATVSVVSATFSARAGDANQDRRFDQHDIVLVLQANKYLTGEPADFSEGDWNADDVFDQQDIVAALQTGNYRQGPYAGRTAATARIRGSQDRLGTDALDWVMADYPEDWMARSR